MGSSASMRLQRRMDTDRLLPQAFKAPYLPT